MDVNELLRRAVARVPPDLVNGAGLTVAVARDYLDEGEPGLALTHLTDYQDAWRATPGWWDLLIEAAERMGMTGELQWCRWARDETVHGIIRARLLVAPTAGTLPGSGACPRWDIGLPSPLAARVRVEYAYDIAPGTAGSVRLAPANPRDWRGVHPGQRIVMHDDTSTTGHAEIIQVTAPADRPGQEGSY